MASKFGSDSKGDSKSIPDDMRDTSAAAHSTGHSTSSGDQNTPGSNRKERGAIAAQACDTCRSRKQKCDEQRPKCSTCQKFKLECNYREPQPTKKDRTLMEILDRIKGLEDKIDRLDQRGSYPPQAYQTSATTVESSITMSPSSAEPQPNTPFRLVDPRSMSMSTNPGTDDSYIYSSSATQMMAWPVMQRLLETIKDKVPGLDPARVAQEGPAVALGLQEENRRVMLSADGRKGQMEMIGPNAAHAPGGLPVTLETLTWDVAQRLSKAFFDSLNFLSPLVDREVFNSQLMPQVFKDGFTENMPSTIALLVFALGELALSGSQGIPIHMFNGRPSGLKGGTALEPPGLALFNEARKRLGFNLTEVSIENIQAYALAGIYYGACSHNTEQWRMTTDAGLAIGALVASKPSELSSPRGDLIRRAFWHCCMLETCIILELGMPTSGLEKLEKVVGLPDFSDSLAEEDYLGNQSTHFQEHFASQIVLRRLMIELHTDMSQGPSPRSSPQTASPAIPGANTPIPSPPGNVTDVATIKRHAHQLDQWRGMLPVPLQWEEESPGAFPSQHPAQGPFHSTAFPRSDPGLPPVTPHHQRTGSSAPSRSGLMFTSNLDSAPTPYHYAYDIQVGLLRTRFYYTKYLVHRPYLYKAIHSPDTLTTEDAQGAATCLAAALKWPITMSPACTRKRLVPCLYFWTQNVMGVLLVLHLARTDPMLQRIVRGGLCGDTWEADANETVGLYTDWLRDLSEADPAAMFGWRIVKNLYGITEG